MTGSCVSLSAFATAIGPACSVDFVGSGKLSSGDACIGIFFNASAADVRVMWVGESGAVVILWIPLLLALVRPELCPSASFEWFFERRRRVLILFGTRFLVSPSDFLGIGALSASESSDVNGAG